MSAHLQVPSLRRAVALSCTAVLVTAGLLALAPGVAYADGSTGTTTTPTTSTGSDAPEPGSQNMNRYSLTAEGDGMYIEVTDPSLPATTTVAVSPYSAQSSVNSQGQSSAFAGLPYLGSFAETVTGTVNGLSGGNFPPLPAAPGYVATSYPSSAHNEEAQGPYLVSATSSQYMSKASSGSGVSANANSSEQQAYSTSSSVVNDDGSVVAAATAGVDGLSIGPLDALNVSSSETITETGTGKPQVVGQTNLGTVTILGFKLGIDQDGFTLLGDNLPLPTKTILDNVNAALGKAGIVIEVIPGDTVTDPATGATSVTSSALRVTEAHQVTTQGPVSVAYTFGRATVSAVDVGIPATPPISPGGLGGTGGGGTPGGTSGSSGGVTSVPGGSLSAPTGDSGSAPLSDVPVPSVAVPSTGDPGGVSSSHPSVLGFLTAAPTGQETWAIYLVLVLAGVGILGGQQLFRYAGIRLVMREA